MVRRRDTPREDKPETGLDVGGQVYRATPSETPGARSGRGRTLAVMCRGSTERRDPFSSTPVESGYVGAGMTARHLVTGTGSPPRDSCIAAEIDLMASLRNKSRTTRPEPVIGMRIREDLMTAPQKSMSSGAMVICREGLAGGVEEFASPAVEESPTGKARGHRSVSRGAIADQGTVRRSSGKAANPVEVRCSDSDFHAKRREPGLWQRSRRANRERSPDRRPRPMTGRIR